MAEPGGAMILKWPRGRNSWVEYFILRAFGIDIRVQRYRNNFLREHGPHFAAQMELPWWAGTLHINCSHNHFAWRCITIMFRHVYICISICKPRKQTGFPTGGWSWPT